jgi:hypothetical protein
MVVSEYNTTVADTHRVIRFPLNETDFTLAESTLDGLAHTTEAYESGILKVQASLSRSIERALARSARSSRTTRTT